MNHDLTHLDIFSGIGGFKLAAERAGFRTVAFSEVEPYASAVLAERWPGTPNIGDVRIRSNFARFRGVTVLSGGFPCQPWSYSGKRRGQDDDRHLWPAMCGVIEITEPTWIVGENVPGLIGMGLDHVISDLEGLGYSIQPFVIPACAVDAFHRRDRVWILAHANKGLRRAEPGQPQEERPDLLGGGRDQDVADAQGARNGEIPTRQGKERKGAPDSDGRGDALADTDGQGLQKFGEQQTRIQRAAVERSGARRRGKGWAVQHRWIPEPDVGRVAHGVPHRPHRLKALGNAIVPQNAEPFFQWIAQIERGEITNL